MTNTEPQREHDVPRSPTERDSVVRPAFLMARAALLGQVCSLLVIPIAGTLYSPDAFGRFGVFLAVVGIAYPFVTLNYHAVIISADSDDDSRRLTELSLWLAVPIGLLLWLALGLCSRLSGFDWIALPTSHLLLFPLATWAYVFANVSRQAAIRAGQFGSVSSGIAIGNLIRVALYFVFGWFQLGSLGIIFAEILTQVSIGRRFSSVVPFLLAVPRREHIIGDHRTVASRYRICMSRGMPATLLNSMATLLPLPLLVAGFGPAAGGFYMLAQRIVSLPVTLASRSLGEVFKRRLHTENQAANGTPRKLLDRAACLLLGIALLGLLSILFVAPPLVEWMTGEKWVGIGLYLKLVALPAMAALVVSPLSGAVAVYRAFDLKLIYGAVCLGNVAACFLLLPRLGLSVSNTIAVYGVMVAIIYAGYYTLIRTRVTVRSSVETPPEIPKTSPTPRAA